LQNKSEKECKKEVINQVDKQSSAANNEDTTATEEPRIDSTIDKPSKAAIDTQTQETNNSVPPESQPDSMGIDDESQIHTQTQEFSSVPLESQPDSMGIVDESPKAALDSTTEVDESQNAVPLEKEKLQLTTSGTEPKIIGRQANDNESQKEKEIVNYNNTILVENNTSENQVVTTEDVPKEIETYSTDIQQTKDDNNSKESSQENNLQKKADNSSTLDHMNNFKGNEENMNI
jgi:hypothetical protein